MIEKILESTQETEGICQVSKWLDFPILLSGSEMRALFREMGHFYLIQIDQVVAGHDGVMSQEEFLNLYDRYIADWEEGRDLGGYKKFFLKAITQDLEAIYVIDVGNDKRIYKTRRPTILLQPYRIDYSSFDGKFHPMAMSQSSLSWGVQLSYPQLYQDPKTALLEKIGDSFPNTALFKKVKGWIRKFTIPTTFFVDNKQITLPMRIGKESKVFANKHIGLLQKPFRVGERS